MAIYESHPTYGACGITVVSRKAIHQLKHANGLGGRDNVIIDGRGDVFFQKEEIDNIWNYLK